MSERKFRARAVEVLDRLEPLYGHLSTGLTYGSPLQLMMATILSAQCTDERVNTVTPALFARFATAQDFVDASPEEIEEIIRPCGFYRNKRKSIQANAAMLVQRFGGEVPATMADLISLPGVARKTANVVLAHAFDRHEGIAVDTHVMRLSQRLHLTVEKDPVKIERDLMRVYPKQRWGRVSDLLIWHGRNVCAARAPRCTECVLVDLCPSVQFPDSTGKTSSRRRPSRT